MSTIFTVQSLSMKANTPNRVFQSLSKTAQRPSTWAPSPSMLDLDAPLEPRLWVDLLELTAPPEVLRQLEPLLRADLPVRQLPVSQSSPEHACSHTPKQVEGTWRSSSSFSLHLSGKRGTAAGPSQASPSWGQGLGGNPCQHGVTCSVAQTPHLL